MSTPEAPLDPVDIVSDYELPPGEIGEIIVSGWHVNTYQVYSCIMNLPSPPPLTTV